MAEAVEQVGFKTLVERSFCSEKQTSQRKQDGRNKLGAIDHVALLFPVTGSCSRSQSVSGLPLLTFSLCNSFLNSLSCLEIFFSPPTFRLDRFCISFVLWKRFGTERFCIVVKTELPSGYKKKKGWFSGFFVFSSGGRQKVYYRFHRIR